MRKTIALAMSAGLGLAALAGAALADKGPGMFGRADTNGDGFVSKDEFAAGRNAMFAKLDANGDGALSPEEFKKLPELRGQLRGKAAKRGKTPSENP